MSREHRELLYEMSLLSQELAYLRYYGATAEEIAQCEAKKKEVYEKIMKNISKNA